MKFIKLTEEKQVRTNDPETKEIITHSIFKERYFNVDKIENFIRAHGVTYVDMPDTIYEVRETPEEIIQLIEQTKEI